MVIRTAQVKEKVRCAKTPCLSCPYRKDVPSGVWDKEEYAKLLDYDGSMIEQANNPGSRAAFMCHMQNGNLCSGWVGAHGPFNLLALRLCHAAASVFVYVSPVPLFKSGAAAAKHGLKSIRKPGKRAREMIAKLIVLQSRRRKY